MNPFAEVIMKIQFKPKHKFKKNVRIYQDIGMDALLDENQQLKEQLFANQTAIEFVEKYAVKFSNIYHKVTALISKTENVEKQSIIRDNAIGHIKDIIETVYSDNIVYESRFGTMLVNEIKEKGEHFIIKLETCVCTTSPLIMLPSFTETHHVTVDTKPHELMIEHEQVVPNPVEQNPVVQHNDVEDVNKMIELIENLKVDELSETQLKETKNDPALIPQATSESFDELFQDEMQNGFIEYTKANHPVKFKKILLEPEKIENKELEKLIKSYTKANPDIRTKIKKYEEHRNEEERMKEVYETKYGDKYKRKKDDTIFESNHFKKWMQKNMFTVMDGGAGKRQRDGSLINDTAVTMPIRSANKVRKTKREISNFSRYTAFNHLLETIDIFDISSESLDDLYTNTGTIQHKDIYGRVIVHGMNGGAKPLLENSQFEEHYDTIRLLTDMKHDFSHNNSFQKVFKAIPPFFKQGIMNEPLFMAKVISTKYDFYQNLYVRDATRAKYMKPGEKRKPFDKADLGTIKKIVCDMPLGAEYHVDDTKDNTKLQRIYTYGNHLDPSPVTGKVTELYDILQPIEILNTLNTIVKKFFMSFFKVIDPSSKDEAKYQDLIPNINRIIEYDNPNKIDPSRKDGAEAKNQDPIPKINRFIENPSKMKYFYQFVGSDNEFNGTDFEINKIDALTPPLTEEGLKIYEGFSAETKLLYKMTFKELGDHIQLHELKDLRQMYQSATEDIIFGTRDQILIADAFKQNEPILFWFDSVANKFDPGAKLSILGDESSVSPITGKGSYKSMLFYYSTKHKTLIDYSNNAVMKSLVENKLNKYTSIISNTKFGREDTIVNILNVIQETKTKTFSTFEEPFKYYYSQIVKIINSLYNTGFTLDIDGIVKQMDTRIQFSDGLNANEQINNYVLLIQSALRITDISFETIFQYGTITQEINRFKINREVDTRLLNRHISNFMTAKESRSTPKRVEDIFGKLKSMRKHAHNIIPTSEKYKEHLQTIFKTLMGLDEDVLNIHSLISNTITWIQDSDKFGSMQMLKKLDEDISHIQELIQTNETLQKRYHEEEPFEIIIPEAPPVVKTPMQPVVETPMQPVVEPTPPPVTNQFSIKNLFPNFEGYDDYFKQLLLIDLFPTFQMMLNPNPLPPTRE